MALGANVKSGARERRLKTAGPSVQLLPDRLCGLQRFEYTKYKKFTREKKLSLHLSQASVRFTAETFPLATK